MPDDGLAGLPPERFALRRRVSSGRGRLPGVAARPRRALRRRRAGLDQSASWRSTSSTRAASSCHLIPSGSHAGRSRHRRHRPLGRPRPALAQSACAAPETMESNCPCAASGSRARSCRRASATAARSNSLSEGHQLTSPAPASLDPQVRCMTWKARRCRPTGILVPGPPPRPDIAQYFSRPTRPTL
jgi:hypothetical protein